MGCRNMDLWKISAIWLTHKEAVFVPSNVGKCRSPPQIFGWGSGSHIPWHVGPTVVWYCWCQISSINSMTQNLSRYTNFQRQPIVQGNPSWYCLLCTRYLDVCWLSCLASSLTGLWLHPPLWAKVEWVINLHQWTVLTAQNMSPGCRM